MLLLEGPKFASFSFYPDSVGDPTAGSDQPFTINGHRIVLAPPQQNSPSASANSSEPSHKVDDDSHTARTASSVWDCSIVLSKYMETLAVRCPGFWKSKRVLELGAGQGIVSMSAIALGASSVTITDLESALPTIQESIRLNGYTTMLVQPNNDKKVVEEQTKNENATTTRVNLMGLDWLQHSRDLAKISSRLNQFSPLPMSASAGASTYPQFPLDYILASDVVWVDYLIPSLVETMAALLGISEPSPISLAPAEASTGQQLEGTTGELCHLPPYPIILLAHQTRSTRGDKILFDSLEKFGLAKKPIRLDCSSTISSSTEPDEPGVELEDVFQDPLFRKPNITIWKIWRAK